ncbi:unnamed protein product [Linum trigynum]|uniref:Uncharacterized protein n=1 Tax=Linum trigynum TaxID=586398 RepID=A0AAV2EZ39_9ROSI
MPRSSRHKSSKHSSKDAKERDYSDSEKDASLKERKSKEESGSSRVLKESGEKRKLDSKENKDGVGSGNGEYVVEYSSSSKRRKDRAEDGGSDRWNGGEDGKGEVSKKSKEKLSESKSSKRREGSLKRDDGGGENEEVVGRRSSGKSEGKHKESSSRKDGADRDKDRERDRDRERERDRDRRGKESRSEKLIDGEDLRSGKQVSEKTVLKALDTLHDPEPENIPEKRTRRKRDGSGDGDKYQDDVTKDARYRDKNHEGETRHRDEKQRDDRAPRDHINSRSSDKHSRDEQDGTGSRHKKSKTQDIECDRDRDSDYDRDCEHDIGRDRGYERGREGERHRERVRDRENDRDHDWDWERDRERGKDHERERDRDRDRDRDYDSLYVDDRRDRNRESRSRKRSPDDLDDDVKLRSSRGSYTDVDNKIPSGSRIEGDADRGRSQSRQSHHENNLSGNRRRASPVISSQGAADEYRFAKTEDVRYRDDGPELRPRANNSRDGSLFSGGSDRSSKLRSSEKPMKMDDVHSADFPLERTTSSKASPMGLVERSPTSNSLDRRYMGRNNVRRSLEIDESGRRNSGSMGARDVPSIEERSVRDLPMDKEDSSLNGSSFYNRSSQPNSLLNPPPSSIRGGVNSPSFLGSFDDDGRLSTSSGRYKRTGDLNMGRGQVNAWRGAPNWPSPLPNGFIPFQHGPHHGGFPPMLSPFPNPSLFGRPSMELSHSGIPYHITDADRFSGHLRPLGWQNMMDGSGSSHLHGWDGGSNGIFRDDGHMFGGPEWNQNRHAMNGHGWDSSSDIWKGQNGDITTDLTSKALKEDNKVQAPVDDNSAVLAAGQKLMNETSNKDGSKAKAVENKTPADLAVKESSKSHLKTTYHQRIVADPPKTSSEDHFSNFINAYLSKVDISSELTSSDLYSRCMGLLKVEVNASVDEDADVLINLKDGARAVPKNSSVFFSNTLFPASSDSIFKRAMGIYTKQRATGMPCIQGGIIDVIQASSEPKEEQQQHSITHKDGEKAEEPLTSNLDIEMADAPPALNVEQKVPVDDDSLVSTEEAKMEEIHATTPSEEAVPVCADSTARNLESVDEETPRSDVERNIPLECLVGLKVDEEERSSDAPMYEGSVPDNPPRGGSLLPTDGQEEGDEGNSGSTDKNVEEEKMEVRDAECSAAGGSLVLVEDDDGCSSRATEGLMPGGTNESDESVLLSRIHHSPESTH